VSTAKLLKCQFKDLLDRSLLERGMIEPSFEEADIWEIVSETLLILKDQMDLKKISLIQKIEKVKGIIFQIDVMRLQQVLINLMSNAIKYSPMEAKITILAKLWPVD
jgi:signal transduction histidine kinase